MEIQCTNHFLSAQLAADTTWVHGQNKYGPKRIEIFPIISSFTHLETPVTAGLPGKTMRSVYRNYVGIANAGASFSVVDFGNAGVLLLSHSCAQIGLALSASGATRLDDANEPLGTS